MRCLRTAPQFYTDKNPATIDAPLLGRTNKEIEIARMIAQMRQEHKESQIVSKLPGTVTEQALQLLKSQPPYYAVIQVVARHYLVTTNDLVIAPYIRNLKIGDELEFDRLTEFGSKDFVVRGDPIIESSNFKVKGVVTEHRLGPIKVRYQKRKRRNHAKVHISRHHYTVLRITKVDVAKESVSS